MCGVPEYCDAVTSHLNSVSKFIEANKEYGGLPSIVIDYNVVEVRDGHFFIINQKRFVRDWYESEEWGVVTPRCFKPYDYEPDLVPYPQE